MVAKNKSATKTRPGKPRIEINLGRVTELASKGLSHEQIAASLGISRTTLQARKAESEQFAQAIEKGQAQGVETVANALFMNAVGGNVTAQIFWLKARAQWRDRPDDLDDNVPEAQPVKIEVSVVDARKRDADA